MCLQYPLLSCTARRDLPSVNLQFGKATQYTADYVVLILNQILINIQFLSLFSLDLLQWLGYTAWQGVYELFVGKQPTVGAGLPRPAPIDRPASPWSSSKRSRSIGAGRGNADERNNRGMVNGRGTLVGRDLSPPPPIYRPEETHHIPRLIC